MVKLTGISTSLHLPPKAAEALKTAAMVDRQMNLMFRFSPLAEALPGSEDRS
jgi:hypothetical protein